MRLPHDKWDRKALAGLALILVAAALLLWLLWPGSPPVCESALPWVCGK